MRYFLIALLGLVVAAPTAAAAPRTAPFTLFPVVGGATYTDDFGDSRAQGSHEGNDLLAPCGTPAIAVVPGTIRLDWGSRSGWMVTLTGATSWYRYIHMGVAGNRRSALAPGLRDGSEVKAGQVISYVGRTGDAQGAPCHLHFELRYGRSKVVSPYRWLQQAEIVQANPNDPTMSTQAAAIALTIRGTVAWAALRGDEGRIAIRPSAITDPDGKRVERSGLVVLRATPDCVAQARVGRRAVITTAPAKPTAELLELKPLSWTAAAIR